MQNMMPKYRTAIFLGLTTLAAFAPAWAGDDLEPAAEEVRNAWLTSKLYGNDNDGAALRRVTISETSPGTYSVLINNQFGFQCNLLFGEDGNPRQLSDCISKGVREGDEDDEWFVKEPDVIALDCSRLATEVVCRGRYVLAAGKFTLGTTEMIIAMPR